jgi:hypothetical protein
MPHWGHRAASRRLVCCELDRRPAEPNVGRVPHLERQPNLQQTPDTSDSVGRCGPAVSRLLTSLIIVRKDVMKPRHPELEVQESRAALRDVQEAASQLDPGTTMLRTRAASPSTDGAPTWSPPSG